jgi:hypothetical protein
MATLTPTFSILFRLATYFYLRVIPVHRIARFVLPTLYAAYVTSTFVTTSRPSTIVIVPEKVKVIDVVDTKTEQEVVAVESVAIVEPANGNARTTPSPPPPKNVSAL